MIATQGIQGIAFFEATACLTLLVLFVHLKRDNPGIFYKLWLFGWICLTLSSFSELAFFFGVSPSLYILAAGSGIAALVLFLASIVQFTLGQNRFFWPMIWLAGLMAVSAGYYQAKAGLLGEARWESSILQSVLCLATGWLLWRESGAIRGHGTKLLAGAFTLLALNNINRPQWTHGEIHLLRLAFDHFLNASLGIGMIVLLLEAARIRSLEISEKMRQFTLLTASSSQSVALPVLLQQVLGQITSSLGVTHGMIRLKEGDAEASEYVRRASVGYSDSYLKQLERLPASSPWLQAVIQEPYRLSRFEEEKDPKVRRAMADEGLTQVIYLPMRGKKGVVGLLKVGALPGKRFHEDELAYLANVASFLGTTVENVNLFEQIKTVQQQWVYTFDSIGDPILVHDNEGRIVRGNLRLANLLGRNFASVVGRYVNELFNPRTGTFHVCPYCEGITGDADSSDPWLHGYFLASNSTFSDPAGRKLGTIHVLKDITERKRAEEKYRNLVASVQEGVFISTLQGRFLDFNDALMRIVGYEIRDELMQVEIAPTLYVNIQDRERLKKLLHEHGAVNDFEFEIRRKDGEVRIVSESSTAIRDTAGNVTAYQGFLLLVLNSIAETLVSSLDLSDSLQRTLRQMLELFALDVASLYLLEDDGLSLRRIAAVGHRSEYSRNFPVVTVPPELIQQIRTLHASFLSAQGLPLPALIADLKRKEQIESAYIVPLWSKDKIVGGLVVGSRAPREFSPADMSLLIAVGSQVAGAVERNQLYEETRQAYEDLRRTQEQLLHSEKLAAVGQLISGVAHELNNPLTAILGYSQLLETSGQVGPLALSYSEKMYKQAQRTHRIVQNLLSFARQHKPERIPVKINTVMEDTLALRDYDLRMGQIRVHLELAQDLPLISADPHQLQQVFLNLINNAVDAILEHSAEGDLWVTSGVDEKNIFIQLTDSGPGVKDPARVFDPFYTTKPVGKGTGLGLSICYGIITEHGGTIRVKNSHPRGACFRIELPLQLDPRAPQLSEATVTQS